MSKSDYHIAGILTALFSSYHFHSSVEVAYKEGPVNLNWGMIMKTVNEDPVEFFKNGGWNFLGQDSDVRQHALKKFVPNIC